MIFRDRPDGTLIKVPSFKKVLTYTCPTRDESSLYFKETLDVENAISILLDKNRGKALEDRITLFHIIIAAYIRTVAERPQVNTFVSGHKFYQRNEISFSLVAKKELTDEGVEGLVKVKFSPIDSMEQVAARMRKAVSVAKSDKGSGSEREVDFLMSLPQPIASAVMWLYKVLDVNNLMPRFMIDNDPSYSSALITNLGSIGVDGVFHHLFNWGNSGAIMAIGKVKMMPVYDTRTADSRKARVLDVYITLDDRLADGTYYGKTLKVFRKYIEHPELLFEPPAYTKEQIDALKLREIDRI